MINTKLTFAEIKTLYDNGFDIQIETPFNYSKILNCYEKYSTGRKITFEDGSSFTGSNTHLIHTGKSEFMPLNSLNVDDDIITQDFQTTKKIINIEETPEQKWIDFSIDHENECYVQSDIIHHNSGKSLILYTICRYLNEKNLKGLIVVPNITLIHQLYSDFQDYSELNGWSTEDNVHKIYSGQDKSSEKGIYLSTWQSLMHIKKTMNEKQYFDQFDFVLVDECHGIKGNELSSILEKCTNAQYRIGLTGTTGNCKANINTIIGLTGSINKLNTTKELIEKNEVSNFNIKCLILDHDIETKKLLKKSKYHDEIKFLTENTKRNVFIKNLALSMESNSLLLFNFIDHGKLLYEMIKTSKHIGDRNVYLIYGEIDGEERERIRNIIETEKNAIILASVQTTGTGVSIKNLHNIVFCQGTKSSIRLLQAIGRAIRLHDSKEKATIYDIVDDLSILKHKNFSIQHFLERVKIYNEQQFNYKLIKIPI